MFSRLLASFLAVIATAATATVTPLPGVTPQRTAAFTPFAVPIAVRVADGAGQPVEGADVWINASLSFRFDAAVQRTCDLEFMSVLVCKATTGADGVASFGIATVDRAGAYSVLTQAQRGSYPNHVDLGSTRLELTVDPAGPLATVAVVEGNDQRGVIGKPLAPIVMRILGPDGRPRSQVPLYVPVSEVPGGFERPAPGGNTVTTDDQGFVTLPRLIASWGVGPHEVEVRYFEPDAATFVTAKVRYTATTAEGATTLQLSDLWWGGAPESGWGMSVFQHGDRLFNVWFVYGEDTQPTWFVQSAGRWQDGVGSYFEGAIYSPGSAPWFAYDASRFDVGPEVGRGSVSFNGPDTAFSYFYEKRPLTLSPQMGKSVQRQPFGQGVAAPIQDVADLWWGGPSQNGWGLAIHERAGTLFMVWFTYDASGRPTWFVMPGGRWTATGTYEGTVYRTKGPYWGGLFDASRVTTQAVGTFELRFASANAAQMDLVVEGRSLALPLVRQGF